MVSIAGNSRAIEFLQDHRVTSSQVPTCTQTQVSARRGSTILLLVHRHVAFVINL
jgi:methylaspartate ammonia-lyase